MNKIFYLALSFFVFAFLYPVVSKKWGVVSFDSRTNLIQLSGIVTSVIDGDTIEIRTDSDGKMLKIRFKGIDCPETSQPWGDIATKYLTAAIEHFPVTVDVADTDRYGRSVGIVYHDGLNINKFMVEQGHCWVYPQYADDPELFKLEETARNSRIGLWRYKNPQEPWKYRK
jgi:endonuclease YncB( thermonuclease family)